VDDPSGQARVLVLGWGGTYGAISAAVRRIRKSGGQVAQAHLRHLNPFPANTEEVLRSYDKVVLPEINLGQLSMLLRGKYLVDVISYNRVRGLPFKAEELADVIGDVIASV
jgi:2-oxoglutarate ferredoxin oxidoreductase subunit alpha